MQKTEILSLNKAQSEAAYQEQGPFLVLAGAGSGKTRVLTQRIIHLIGDREVEPARIMAVTFTNKAASEMKNRISQYVDPELVKDLWVGTFHGICNRLLRHEISKVNEKYSSNFAILDAGESQSMIKESIRSLNLDEKIYSPKRMQYQISELKNNCLEPADFEKQVKDSFSQKLLDIYKKYQEKLELSNSLDFDDLLLFTMKLLKNNKDRRIYYHKRFAHLLVDEFQDTNQVQYDFLRMLTLHPDAESPDLRNWTGRSFCAVGDIDQSIYSWRGADYRLALNFQNDYPEGEVIKLEENYRSDQYILDAANAVIQNNKQRIEKSLVCTRGKGERINKLEAADEIEESRFITRELRKISSTYPYSKVAILYRTNAQSRAIEEALMRSNIPYQLIGGTKFYERMEIKDTIAYLRLIYNPHDASALKRIVNTPRRGIGASTIKQIEESADKKHLPLYAMMQDMLDSESFTPRTTKAIHDFVGVMEKLRKLAKELEIPDLIREVLDHSGYLKALENSDSEEAESRIENIRELINVAEDFMETSDDLTLEAFLTQIALVGETDEMTQTDNKVTLMTVHASKGLEYPCVFVTGLEEGVFPHVRSLQTNNSDDLEEERRLLYVAITRAEERLYLTLARRRRLWGVREYAEPSRFLMEIPDEYLKSYYDKASLIQNDEKRPPRSATRMESRKEIDYSNLPTFKEGDQVTHKSFGKGKVVGILGSKKRKFYTVNFEESEFGKKMLAPESLSKVSGPSSF